MTLKPEESPDKLSLQSEGYKGRRLNRLPLLLLFFLSALMIGIVGYTYFSKVEHQDQQAGKVNTATEQALPEPSNDAGIMQSLPSSGEITPRVAEPDAPVSPVNTAVPQAVNVPDQQSQILAQEWQSYAQQQLKIELARQEAALAALDSSTTVQIQNPPQTKPVEYDMTGNRAKTDAVPSVSSDSSSGGDDPNKQQQKAAWLNQQPNTQDYLQNTRKSPVSPYEIKAGTVIVSTMIGGINSDLPGTILGQVSQNVYDSATGQYLLIPTGSKLVGIYDNGVSMGQKRVLIAWNRIIYPDGSSLDLGMMPGTDQGGYAGFQDQVNNHYTQVFGNALLLSLFSAGIQLSQPQSNNDDDYSNSQIVAASIGQQMGALGMSMAQRGLSIAPTIEIRPGYPFNVMVTKDIILKPWEGN